MNCMWNILTNPTDLTLLSVVRSLYILTVTSKKHALTQRADRIEALAKQLSLSNQEVDWQELITEEALNFLALKLATPLQVKQYLKPAFEQAYEVGQKLITMDVVETVEREKFE